MARPLMIQGTMSNVGKTVIAAGLCRVFAQDGHRVAPFKSQNMALNSFVTEDGLEMGRAQVMQAEAAGIAPTVAMNPILLKPMGDERSQVIVNGRAFATMSAADYYVYKKKLFSDITHAWRKLEARFDLVVIEGAGSPAEINLKEDDIVNMGIAKMAGAPVLLVGDIDRGGVFAQLFGTLALLSEEERGFVKGLIINKFRGDQSILDPGIRVLEEITEKKSLGVLPYAQLDLDDEDSLSDRLHAVRDIQTIDIAVVCLPRISNFTDYNVFERVAGLSPRYVKRPKDLKVPDMVILPGTKNTVGDMIWMRGSGMADAVLRAKGRGSVIFGVCGGCQMLGRSISDPEGAEGGGRIRGMGLLPMDTEFFAEKTQARVRGSFGKVEGALACLSGLAIDGYEIHMGQSGFSAGAGSDPAPSLAIVEDIVTGTKKREGAFRDNVYGTCIHGIFDCEAVARGVVTALAARRGIDMPDFGSMDHAADRERQYDRLADVLRMSLDIDRIYAILEEGV